MRDGAQNFTKVLEALSPSSGTKQPSERRTGPSPVIDITRGVIRQHAEEVKRCYEQRLTVRPGLAGRVMMEWIVSPAGVVKHAVLQNSTMNDAPAEDCIGRAICDWRFPPTSDGHFLVLSYPWVLSKR